MRLGLSGAGGVCRYFWGGEGMGEVYEGYEGFMGLWGVVGIGNGI